LCSNYWSFLKLPEYGRACGQKDTMLFTRPSLYFTTSRSHKVEAFSFSRVKPNILQREKQIRFQQWFGDYQRVNPVKIINGFSLKWSYQRVKWEKHEYLKKSILIPDS